MIATIRKDSNGNYNIKCTDPAFVEKWGKPYTASDYTLFTAMEDMTDWANNEANTEMLFEIDA